MKAGNLTIQKVQALIWFLFLFLCFGCHTPRFITNESFNDLQGRVKVIHNYTVEDGIRKLYKIDSFSRNGMTVKSDFLLLEENAYDLDYYNKEGFLAKRESYRKGKLVLINIYATGPIEVPVLDHQFNQFGNKEQIWKPVWDEENRTISLIQNVAKPFLSGTNYVYHYNEKNQLTLLERQVKGRPIRYEEHTYNEAGHLAKVISKRDGKIITIQESNYELDDLGNWIKVQTTFTDPGEESSVYISERQITYY